MNYNHLPLQHKINVKLRKQTAISCTWIRGAGSEFSNSQFLREFGKKIFEIIENLYDELINFHFAWEWNEFLIWFCVKLNLFRSDPPNWRFLHRVHCVNIYEFFYHTHFMWNQFYWICSESQRIVKTEFFESPNSLTLISRKIRQTNSYISTLFLFYD